MPNVVGDGTFKFLRVENDEENIWAPLAENPQIFTVSSSAVDSLVFDEGQSYYPVGDIKTSGDRLINVTSPTIKFESEKGLRVFVEYDDLIEGSDPSFLNVPIRIGTDADPETGGYGYSFSEGIYTVTFPDEVQLKDGSYRLSIEDDAGNRVEGEQIHSFIIETEKPVLSEVELHPDSGISVQDRLVNCFQTRN